MIEKGLKVKKALNQGAYKKTLRKAVRNPKGRNCPHLKARQS
jgi:hypothetical protein